MLWQLPFLQAGCWDYEKYLSVISPNLFLKFFFFADWANWEITPQVIYQRW